MLAAAFVHNPIHGDRRLLTLTSASPVRGGCRFIAIDWLTLYSETWLEKPYNESPAAGGGVQR